MPLDFDDVRGLARGSQLAGGFELRELLGEGGAGRVFEAWENRLRRSVAVKVPVSPLAARALLSEGQALAAFRHEGLPTVHAVGEDNEVPFLVLERLRGTTLDGLIARHRNDKPLPWREAVHYLTAVVEILQVLHRANLVHRDVKPENIMICPSGRVVLLDLGIVQQERQFAGEADVSGTPYYIAPETLSGSVPVGSGHLVDIYALGVLGYELLTGSVPFSGESLPKLFENVLFAPMPRTRDRRPDIPGVLDDLVCALMARNSSDRPESIDSVHYLLRAVAEDRPTRIEASVLSVVMVDDDPDYHDMMRTCSELFSHKIDLRLAGDGATALDMIRERPCDLMIVDLEMPAMTGFEVCMYLGGMEEAKDTLVAVLSGRSKPQDRASLSELGVIDFIDKSAMDIEELVHRLNAILDRAAAARSYRPGTARLESP